MEFALGVLHWSPEQFWKATMHELMAANNGYVKANKIPDTTDKPMTREEYEDLKAKIAKIKAGKDVNRTNS